MQARLVIRLVNNSRERHSTCPKLGHRSSSVRCTCIIGSDLFCPCFAYNDARSDTESLKFGTQSCRGNFKLVSTVCAREGFLAKTSLTLVTPRNYRAASNHNTTIRLFTSLLSSPSEQTRNPTSSWLSSPLQDVFQNGHLREWR